MRNFLILAVPALMTFAAVRADRPSTSVGVAAPSDPSSYRSTTLAARAAFDVGDYPKAEQLYREATRLYPADPNNWRYLAASLRLQGKWAEAIPAYQQLIDRSGSFVGSGRYWQAVGYVKLGQTEAALKTIEMLVNLDHEPHRAALASDEQLKPLWADPRFVALVAPQSSAAPDDRVAGWRGDIDHLVAEIHRLTPDYRDRSLPSHTQQLVTELRSKIPELSDEQVFLGMSDILGSLHQGHTMMWGFSFEPGAKQRLEFSFLPVQPYAFPDGLYVVDAVPAFGQLIGSRIIAIGGMPIDSVLSRVRAASSFGSESEFAWTGPLRTMSLPLLVGIGAAQRGKPVELTIEQKGKVRRVLLPPVTTMLGQKLPRRSEKEIDRTAKNPFELTPPRQDGVVIVRLDQMQDGKDETLAAFGARVGVALSGGNVRSVIVDLRLNNGGNSFLYPELIRALTAFSTRPGRQVYVLIGRNVYSAAGNFATDLERFAHPIFVGEPTGNTGNQFGDEGVVVLPWSGLHATIASVKWQLSHPWDTRGSIVPQVPVAMTSQDYFNGRDPVMEMAAKLAEGSH